MGKWTRRGFIGAGVLTGGALVVGVAVRPDNPIGEVREDVASGPGEQLVNAWVKVDKDNTVTAIVPHCEMGQGAHTALAQMLADEMDADWSKVAVMQAPADGFYVVPDTAREFVAKWSVDAPNWLEPTYNGLFTKVARLADAMITGGSSSVRTTGQHTMRIAGAAARHMLVAAAADEWNVPASEIVASNSLLTHQPSGKTATYGDFAEAASKQHMPQTPPLKDVSQYKLMGRPLQRLDIPAKVNGSAKFGIDAQIAGQALKYAAIRQPPVPGAKIASVSSADAEKMAGVHKVLNLDDFVAVVADSYWQAQQALNAVETTYSKTDDDGLDSAGLYARFSKTLDDAGDSGGKSLRDDGDANDAFAKASKKVTAEYRVPFLAHAAMEPMNCTAWAQSDKCEVWTSTQVPLMARTAIAKALDLSKEDVIVNQLYLGGAFGRRLESDYPVQAARVSKAIGAPVKLIWSREEDTQHDFYRPADISRFSAGIDAAGKPVSWNNAFTQLNDPPGSWDVAHYDIPNVLVRHAKAGLHLRFGSLRSVDHSQQGFFIESFIDELAHAAGQDPFEYRRTLLAKSPRHKAVLERVAQMAGWGTAPAKGTARGIALVPSFGTIVAEVAQVTLENGVPRVTNVWCCADAGYVMNPDGFAAQMEGGINYGLSAALHSQVTLKDGAVEQANFDTFPVLRMNEAPDIAVDFINGNSRVLGGAGEPGLPPIAPAVTNAIFALTGKRIRELPILAHLA
ncbi:xanthine dehydrogenase family protein molybdopterin-binding subunit [Tsuneonella mangrovi]|uniref:xanthine dehydrogenase family protein molybdopterin-binding subunit n=1 Tax=Tsuneonella mangrovi TaxID=1982042 RepID=UPI000BA27895|nr:molybdopterin cofactor-binding domain-containing protein [Tsuneonella mangrovi]